ncbi:transcriptional regulator [Verrucomicrobia bacterium LW23]|nr:transcriptional regulator [Verrucomicrobia bacterium LW23]
MPNHPAELDLIFQALGDATRRAVLERLGRGPAPVSELARHFDMALPSFMQHLRMLESRGLVTTRKHGRVRTCELAPEPLRRAQAWLADQRTLWERRLDQLDSLLLTLREADASSPDTPAAAVAPTPSQSQQQQQPPEPSQSGPAPSP